MALSPNPITNFNQTLAVFLATYGVEFENEKAEDTDNPEPWDWGNLVDCIIQTQWEHNRGDANTVKGVAGGSRTGTADIALASGEFLVNRAGTLQGDTIGVDDVEDLADALDAVDGRLDTIEAISGIVVLDRAFTNLQVSSTSQTTIYSYAIPASLVGANRGLRLTWRGHFFNNDGANRALVFRLQLGGVTIWEEPTNTQTVSATRRPLAIDILLSVQSTTVHIANADVRWGTAATATTGVGDLNVEYQIDSGGESIDSTVDIDAGQTLDLQVAISPSITNAANVYVRRRGAFLELI